MPPPPPPVQFVIRRYSNWGITPHNTLIESIKFTVRPANSDNIWRTVIYVTFEVFTEVTMQNIVF
jgi:hypothetical protein